MMRKGLGEFAVDRIMELIANGTFEAAGSLPPEAELAALVGVSRLTMREAVGVLQDRGVLRVVHGRGTYVAPMDEWMDIGTIISVLSVKKDPRELGLQLIEVRRMIEVGASGLAASNRTTSDLDAMRMQLDLFDQADKTGDVEGALNADLAFHRAIFTASANPFLLTIMRSLEPPMSKSRRFTSQVPEIRARARVHHRNVFAAIEAQDAALAKDAMRAHMTQTRDDLITR